MMTKNAIKPFDKTSLTDTAQTHKDHQLDWLGAIFTGIVDAHLASFKTQRKLSRIEDIFKSQNLCQIYYRVERISNKSVTNIAIVSIFMVNICIQCSDKSRYSVVYSVLAEVCKTLKPTDILIFLAMIEMSHQFVTKQSLCCVKTDDQNYVFFPSLSGLIAQPIHS